MNVRYCLLIASRGACIPWQLTQTKLGIVCLLLELSSVAGLQCSRLGMLRREENDAPAEPGSSFCLVPILNAIAM